jgi:eukaryotic-like serine/threonine-protein kinase
MATPQNPAKSLFLNALEITGEEERQAYVDECCAGNDLLRQELLALLAHHQQIGNFLDSSPAEFVPTMTIDCPTESSATVIGPYKLIEQIGEGGMGTVWMAQQSAPVRRTVALKLIKAGMDSRQIIARFEAERQALAMMDHPHIAKVLDAGTTDRGRPYFVMELVKGVPITSYCDEHHLTPKARLELFVPVCQAIQHAHQKGIIHRDLKPSNVLVSLYDGRPVPKVIDFGVAKAVGQPLTDKTLVTGIGSLVGTLEYMSPEQAEVNQLDIDTRSDIYSLGVLLYELLTGSTPFSREKLQQAGVLEMLRLIREQEPSRPSTKLSTAEGLPTLAANRSTEPAKLTRLVRGELDWIVMKALEKDRNRRYETAHGFAMDLQRYLADEPVEACPPSAAYRLRKFARRHKTVLAGAALASTSLIAAVVVLSVSNVLITRERNAKDNALVEKVQALGEKQAALTQAQANFNEARRQEQLAREQEQIAIRQTKLANLRLHASQMNLATQAWRAGDVARVLELLEGQRPGPDDEDLRSFEWYYLWRLCNSGQRKYLHGHKGAVYSVAMSPDSSVVASASWDGTVRLWDAATGEVQKVLRGHSLPPWIVVFAPDGKTIASCGGAEADCVIVWDVDSGQPRHVISGQVSSLAYAPDSSRMAGGMNSGGVMDVHIWDVATGATQERLPAAGEVIGYLPDGNSLVTITGRYADAKVKFWDLPSGELRQVIADERDTRVSAVALSRDGSRLAMSSPDAPATVWDIATSTRIKSFPEKQKGYPAFSPDGKVLAFAGSRTVTLWDIESGRKLAQDPHREAVQAVAFSPDGKTLVSSSTGVIKLWDMAPAEESMIVANAPDPKSLRFDPSGQQLYIGSTGRTKIVDVASGRETAILPADRVLAISADCSVLAGPAGMDAVAVYSRDGIEVERFPLVIFHDYPALRIETSSDGRRVAIHRQWHYPDFIYLRDLATRQSRIFRPNTPACSVLCANLSPDGRLLAAGFQFRNVSVWDVETAEEKLEIKLGSGMLNILCVAFAPDGKAIATGADDGTVSLWEIDSGRQLAAFRGHAVSVFALAFSPDGATLATGGQDETVRLWDVETGQERCTLPCPGQHIAYLQFSPDGSVLASANHEGIIRLWRAATDAETVALSPSTVPSAKRVAHLPETASDPESTLRTAIELNPKDVHLHHFLGNVLWAQGALSEAIACYRKSIEINPNYRDGYASLERAFISLGKTHREQGKLDEAIEAFQEALKSTDHLAIQSRALARVQRELHGLLTMSGREQDATELFHQVRTRCEKYAGNNRLYSLWELAWFLVSWPDPKFHDAPKAIELAEQLVNEAPTVSYYWRTLGAAYLRGNDPAAAISALEKANEFAKGGSPWEWYFLAMAHWQQGNKEDALQWFDRANESLETLGGHADVGEILQFQAEASKLLGGHDVR